MWLESENALRQALDGVIPGLPVYGTTDAPPLDQPGETYIQVAYLGYRLGAQSHDRRAAQFDLIFTVRIAAHAAAIDDNAITNLDTGLTSIVQRLLAYNQDKPLIYRPALIDSPPPQWAGAAGELAIYFTLRKIMP
jgi:hypothetical protein